MSLSGRSLALGSSSTKSRRFDAGDYEVAELADLWSNARTCQRRPVSQIQRKGTMIRSTLRRSSKW